MNKVFLIGNLTRDPETRTTPSGVSLCSFTIAVNRRRASNADAGQPEADFFRVTAWRQLGENCKAYLAKGRKVYVSGPLTARTYTANDGTTRVSLEVTADDVEFLSSRNDSQGFSGNPAPAQAPVDAPAAAQNSAAGFTAVENDDLPF